jgi:hypothetical protein
MKKDIYRGEHVYSVYPTQLMSLCKIGPKPDLIRGSTQSIDISARNRSSGFSDNTSSEGIHRCDPRYSPEQSNRSPKLNSKYTVYTIQYIPILHYDL